MKVGGDYWRSLSYTVGHHARYFILTDDAAKGELTSSAFTLSRATPYFSFLIGGSEAITYERFELQFRVTSPVDAAELEHQIKAWAETQTASGKPVDVLIREGEYRIAIAFTGHKDPDGSPLDLLQQKTFLLPEFLLGRIARLSIIDASVSTDYTFIPSVSPRFGQHACWGASQELFGLKHEDKEWAHLSANRAGRENEGEVS